MSGSTNADFQQIRQLGAGCSGVVRLVRRRADQKLYALKELELPHNPGEAAAALQETHILAALEHPFIVRYYDSFVEQRKLFLVRRRAREGEGRGSWGPARAGRASPLAASRARGRRR